jgi:hypothetical protein
MSESDDDEALEALLRRQLPVLPDDGFSRAVMTRVRALRAPLAPDQALAQVQRRRAAGRRDARFNRYGSGVGVAFAVGIWIARHGAGADLAAHGMALVLALTISAAAVVWSQLSEPG